MNDHSRVRLALPREAVAASCRRWQVTEFALFGSVLRADFGPASDVDVLVTFAPDAPWTLFDWVDMRDELTQLFGRRVDLVTRRAVEQSRNALRRSAILESAEVIYAAA